MKCCRKLMHTFIQVDADGRYTEIHECSNCFTMVVLLNEE